MDSLFTTTPTTSSCSRSPGASVGGCTSCSSCRSPASAGRRSWRSRERSDFTLEAGDTLYLPRGWPHEATTSQDESLHLTIGMHPPTRLDALRAAIQSSAEDDVEFRRTPTADGAMPKESLERLASRLTPEELSRGVRRRFVATRRPILHDQLAQMRALDRLTPADPLERRATVICELEQSATAHCCSSRARS